jgi:lysyl-tRNA synthetase, class I
MHFDVIPKAMDEYHQQLRAYPDQTPEQQVANPVWHIHGGNPPSSNMVVSFGMLLNLGLGCAGGRQGNAVGLYAANMRQRPRQRAIPIWIRRQALRAIMPISYPGLCGRACGHNSPWRGAARDSCQANMPEYDSLSEELFMSVVRDTGKAHGFENLRAWFAVLYEVLLGAAQGPRWGTFIALYGLEKTVALIDKALAGELAG